MKKMLLKLAVGLFSIFATQEVRCGIPTIVDYTFEDGTPGQPANTLTDSSGNALNATRLNGTPTYSTTGSGGQGSVSLNLNSGGTFQIGSGDPAALNLTGQFTLETAFKPGTNLSGDRIILERVASDLSFYTYSLNYNAGLGKVAFSIADASHAQTQVYAPFPQDGLSHHVAAIYNPTNQVLSLYVDGALGATTTATNQLNIGSADGVFIGANNSGGFEFNGIIDRIRVSNVALTPAQFFVAPLPVQPTGPTIVDYTFEDGTPGQPANTLTDSSGNALNATRLNGTPTYSTTGSGGQGSVSLNLNSGGTFQIGSGDPAALNLTGQFTLETAFKPGTNLSGDRIILERVASDLSFYTYSLNYNAGLGKVAFSIADASHAQTQVYAPFPQDGLSHHVAAIYNPTNQILSLYVDGALGATTTATNQLNVASADGVFIGANNSGGFEFNGIIDRIRVSNVALTPAQFFVRPLPSGPPGTGNMLSMQNLGNHLFQVSIRGLPNVTYELQTSFDMKLWTRILDMTTDSTGIVAYIDIEEGNSTKFYRLVYP